MAIFGVIDMYPEFIQIGRITIYWYGVMFATAFIAAVVHWHGLARRDNRPAGIGVDLALWLLISGIIGARVAYVASDFARFRQTPLEIIRIDEGGLIFYGGFIGASLALIVFARVRREPLWSMADFAITAVPLGHAFGRIGCFLNGCCFGTPTTAPWGMALFDAVRHPTQLYEAGFNALVYALLLGLYLRKRRDGTVFAAYLMLYPAGRFFFEFLRGDERVTGFGLNVAQELSLILIVVGALLWIVLPNRLHAHGKHHR